MTWFDKIICYPKFTEDEYKRRIEELKSLGIEDIIEEGKTLVYGKRILGKGTTALVVKAVFQANFVALKIRRTDSNRESMEKEAQILNLLKDTGIVPKVLAYSKNFIVMELVEGEKIDDFLNKADHNEIKRIIKRLLEICIILDKMGIDHGDLNNASDHIIIGNDIKIIDFESASINRRAQNLTSIVSYLFLSNKPFSKKILSLFKFERDEIIKILREYKKGNYESIKFLLDKLLSL